MFPSKTSFEARVFRFLENSRSTQTGERVDKRRESSDFIWEVRQAASGHPCDVAGTPGSRKLQNDSGQDDFGHCLRDLSIE